MNKIILTTLFTLLTFTMACNSSKSSTEAESYKANVEELKETKLTTKSIVLVELFTSEG
jgi:hypothetical protein